MPPFYIILLSVTAGAGITFLLVRSGPTLKQKRVVAQLLADNAKLETDKIGLKNTKDDLAKIIGDNQQRIKELNGTVEFLGGQVVLCLELLASTTTIRDKGIDLSDKIIVTKRYLKKNNLYLDSVSLEKLKNLDTYMRE